jgi:ribonuclease P protein component
MRVGTFLFQRQQRLTSKKDYAEMFSRGTRRKSGCLLVTRKKNAVGYPRIGLSVPKKVGNAFVRNSIKRKCREAFRLAQHELPAVDILLTVRPHEIMDTEEYKNLILLGIES